MTNVLYLSYDGITDPLGQSQILPYLKGLSKKGYFFYLVGFEKMHAYKKQKEVIENEIKGFDIKWIPKTYHKFPIIFSTIYDIWVMKNMANKLVLEENIQIIHCRSYITMLVGLNLKRRLNIKLLFDMRGFWADERIDGNIWNLKNPFFKWIYAYFKKKEIQFALESDHIVSLTHAGKNEMVSGNLFSDKTIKIAPNKISIIPCSTDLDLFAPEKVSASQIDEFKLKLNIAANDKTLIYLGSLGTWYMVKEMLQFFKVWKSQHPEYKFLFMTKDDMQQVYQHCQELGIKPTDILYSSASRNEVPIYLKLADLGIFFIKPAYSKKASSAVKMGEMMAMGLPLVTNKGIGDSDFFIDKYKYAYLINPEQIDIDLISLENHSRPIKTLEYFNLKTGINNYLSIYQFLR